MTQKKLFGTIALAVVAAVSFTSCNQSPKADDEAPKSQAPSNLKIAYVEVDSLMTQYEYCKEYSLILEKKSQNIQSTLQQISQGASPQHHLQAA